MSDHSFTIMTANVAAGLAPVASIAAAIRAGTPDIVALVELPRGEAERLGAALAGLYPHTAFIADRNEGRGILSRYPIREYRGFEVAPGRPDLVSIIDTPGHDLTVVVAHPRPQRITRTGLLFTFSSLKQVLSLARYASEEAPAVLLGDLNMSPRHPGYRRLERLGLRDAWAETNEARGNTFPIRIGHTRFSGPRLAHRRVPPIVRFDYIWCTKEIAVQDAWIGPDTGSDHASVVARLRLPERGEG